MIHSPFESETAVYRVLVNDEGQYSLWPVFAEIPPGWRIERDQDSRDACLRHIADHWKDMRPLSMSRPQ